MRKRIFEIMQISKKDDAPSMAFDIVLVLVIFANIAAMFMQTFSSLSDYHNICKTYDLLRYKTDLRYEIKYILDLRISRIYR